MAQNTVHTVVLILRTKHDILSKRNGNIKYEIVKYYIVHFTQRSLYKTHKPKGTLKLGPTCLRMYEIRYSFL